MYVCFIYWCWQVDTVETETKAIYRIVRTKCTLWNETSCGYRDCRWCCHKEAANPLHYEMELVLWCLARICEIPIVKLNAMSSKFGLKAITEQEHQFLREYCMVMKLLTVAVDILQGEDNCFHGPWTLRVVCKSSVSFYLVS